MQCGVCGRAVGVDDRFCTACGAPIAAPTDHHDTDTDTDRTDTHHTDTGQDGAAQQPEAEVPDGPVGTEPADQPDILPDADRTGEMPTTAPVVPPPNADESWDDVDPVWAATGPVPQVVPLTTDQLPATRPMTVADDDLWSAAGTEPATTQVVGHDPVANQPTAVVATTTARSTAEIPVMPTAIRERRRFRFTAVTGLSILGSAVMMFAMFATIVTVSSDDRIVGGESTPANFRIGSWIPSDLADNLPIAGLIAVSLLMCGGVAAGFGWRGGSGLAAGSGLAIAGLAALTIGLAQIPIDAAYEMAAIPTDERFTLTITRDLGYWLQLAAAAIGIIVFFASLNDAFGDHRSGLNPWIAALGALSGLVMAAGPLVPDGMAVFSDNWYVTEGPGQPPAMLLSTRLVQLALLGLTSLIGFLSVRRWGLGVAVGGALPSLWLTVSTMFELTDHPVGPGFRNPGATEMVVHGMTIIGASALAAFLLLALVAAYDQAQHEW